MAAEIDRPVAQVALARAMGRPGITSTLMGASKVAQLESNMAAVEIALTDDQMARLNDASFPPPNFSSSLVTPQIRRMIFGGQTVTAWGE